MEKRDISLGQYLDEWLGATVKGNVRYGTYVSYDGYVNNHIKRLIGDISINELKPATIQKFVGDLTAEKNLCARTIKIVVATLSNALRTAEDYELIERNPCRRIRLPKVDEEEVRAFTNAEQTRIENAVLRSDDDRNYGILVTLYTGLRIGELCALKWENINLASGCLYVKASLNRTERADNGEKKTRMLEQEPKTRKSKRAIQLPEFIVGVLRGLKRKSRSKYVISTKHGGFVNPRTMQILYKKLLKRAGVEYNNFHVLRHTFATRAAELNTDPKTVSETLGHTNAVITINRYTHSLIEQKRKLTRGLNNYFRNKRIAVFV